MLWTPRQGLGFILFQWHRTRLGEVKPAPPFVPGKILPSVAVLAAFAVLFGVLVVLEGQMAMRLRRDARQ
jgi:hypothetical protein